MDRLLVWHRRDLRAPLLLINTNHQTKTTMNLYNPTRQADESQADYRARRLAAKQSVDRMTLAGIFAPGKVASREQHRDAIRSIGSMQKHAGAYGRGLRNWINREAAKRDAERLVKRMAAA